MEDHFVIHQLHVDEQPLGKGTAKGGNLFRIRRTPEICAKMERKMQPLSPILAHPRINTKGSVTYKIPSM